MPPDKITMQPFRSAANETISRQVHDQTVDYLQSQVKQLSEEVATQRQEVARQRQRADNEAQMRVVVQDKLQRQRGQLMPVAPRVWVARQFSGRLEQQGRPKQEFDADSVDTWAQVLHQYAKQTRQEASQLQLWKDDRLVDLRTLVSSVAWTRSDLFQVRKIEKTLK